MELDLHLFNVTTVDHHFDHSATIINRPDITAPVDWA